MFRPTSARFGSLVAVLVGAAATAIGLSCTGGPDKVLGSGLMTIAVTPDSASLFVGGTQTFTAQLETSSGKALTGIAVVWSSDSASIATIDSATGLVTAVAPGTARIAASAQGVNGYATVNVAIAPVATVTITPHPDTVALNASGALTATLKDAQGDTLSGRTVTWASSNAGVVTIGGSTGQTQTVTAKGVGTAKITATSSNGIVGTDSVVVIDPINYIVVTPNPLSVRISHTVNAHAQAYDANNVLLTGIPFIWTTKSGGTVASVNSTTGVVAGVAVGLDSVYATAQGKIGGAAVTVSADQVASITIAPLSDSIYASSPGNTALLTATQRDSAGQTTNAALTWASSSPVATAVGSGNTGTVTGTNTAAGTTTITAQAANGVQGQATVLVIGHVITVVVATSVDPSRTLNPPGTFFSFYPTSATATATLTDTFANDVTSQRPVTWTTSDPTTLTINGSSSASVTVPPGSAVTLNAISNNSQSVTVTAKTTDGAQDTVTLTISSN